MSRWLLALLFLLFTMAPSSLAQKDDVRVPRTGDEYKDDTEPEKTTGSDALPYTIAILSTAVVMIVVVKPTRKM